MCFTIIIRDYHLLVGSLSLCSCPSRTEADEKALELLYITPGSSAAHPLLIHTAKSLTLANYSILNIFCHLVFGSRDRS
jgi:hypothetical protein